MSLEIALERRMLLIWMSGRLLEGLDADRGKDAGGGADGLSGYVPLASADSEDDKVVIINY